MGGGASRGPNYGPDEEEDWDDVPVNRADLQTDGRVDMRHNEQALADQASFTTDYGKVSKQSLLAADPHAVHEAQALEDQAAAHWHRIITHTREQRLRAHENGEETPCPLCGQMTDDIQFCGFCGDIEEATQLQMQEEQEREEADIAAAREVQEAKASSPSSQGSPPSGRIGSFLSSTRSLLSGGLSSPDSPSRKGSSFTLGGSPGSGSGSGSPSSPNSFRKSSNYADSRSRGTGSSLVNIDAEKEEMHGVLNTLLEGSLAARNRGRNSDASGKSAAKLRARLAELEQEEANIADREEAHRLYLEEEERRNAVRKFVGLGLDSDSDSDDEDDVDYETRQLKKKLREMKGNGSDDEAESDYDESGNEVQGTTSWQRSPFFRLININHQKKDIDQKNKEGKKKKRGTSYDSEDERLDTIEVGEAPHPALPPVQIELKKRDSTSIELSWDVSVDVMQMLGAVRQAYGKKKNPIYQVQYRDHTQFASNATMIGESSKGGNKSAKNELTSAEEEEKKWKMGIPRSRDFGGTITGLLPNTSYLFRARRIGWCPNKWESSVPVVIRSGPGKPSPPRSLASKEVSSESILLSWNIPEKDNGLPVYEYVVHIKPYGGNFLQCYQGKERCYLSVGLAANVVHVFQVQAINKAGRSIMSERHAVRTLPPGAAALSPWVEVVDERAHKIFFCHSKTNAIAWKLPEGALLDETGSFKNKRNYLLNQMQRRMTQLCAQYNVEQRPLQIHIDRSNLLEASLRVLHQTPAIEIDQGPIRVRFKGEEGLDAGGLAKDWFVEMAKRLFDDSTGLLIVNEETGYVTIDQRCTSIHSESEAHRLFRAVGTFIAKAVMDGQTLGIKVDPLLLCHMVGKVPSLDSFDPTAEDGIGNVGCMNGLSILAVTEPQFYKGLKWVQENDVEGADLTFTCSYELFDESQIVELVPLGGQLMVDNKNKFEYVRLMTKWLLKDRYEPALTDVLEGFSNHVQVSKMKFFSIKELELLITGVPDIDVNELKANAQFGGFVSQSDQVLWLFAMLEELDHEKLGKFLQFVSGCPCLPVDGLKPPLLVTLMEEISTSADSTLPRSHTCFNQIVIPRYSSLEVMKKQIVYALENAAEGFFIS